MKNKIYKLFYVISIILMISFIGFTIADYVSYNSMLNSAPFSVFILVRFLEFVVPAIVFFILGVIFNKKYKQN